MVVAFVVFVVVLRVVEPSMVYFENMRTNLKTLVSSFDASGLLLSLSGIVAGILFAFAEYHVNWGTALALILTVLPMHIYMQTSGKLWMAASVAGAFLTVYLSYSTLFSLESLLLLLFSYFIIRMAKGLGDGSKVMDGVLYCFLRGPVALVGAYFVCTHSFPFWLLILPALSIGLLCAATEGTKAGYGRNILTLLIFAAILLMLSFSVLRIFFWLHFIFAAIIPVFVILIVRMYKEKEQDPGGYRHILALSTFLFALLAGIGFAGHLL